MADKLYLVEVETSTLRTYKVRHMTEDEIRRRRGEFADQLDAVEKHEQTRVKSLIEIEDDED